MANDMIMVKALERLIYFTHQAIEKKIYRINSN